MITYPALFRTAMQQLSLSLNLGTQYHDNGMDAVLAPTQ